MVEWNDATYWSVHLAMNEYYGKTGNVYANIVDSGGGWHFVNVDGVLSSNVWSHVALTYDKNSGYGKIYTNGVQAVSTYMGSFTPQTGSTYDVYLGRRIAPSGDACTFEGALDEVSLYNRVLTSTEINNIYNAGYDGKVP